MMSQLPMDLIVYREYEGSDMSIIVDIGNETVWVTQKQIATLLDITVATVNKSIKRVRTERGKDFDSVIRQYLITAEDGKTYEVDHYDMTVVNLVGARAHHSKSVAAFQNWVGRQLNQSVSQHLTPVKNFTGSKKYRELLASGYSHDQALEWNDTNTIGVAARKRAVAEWYKRRGDIAKLTNHATLLASGKSATALKRDMHIKGSPRAYMSSVKKTALAIVEDIGSIIHRRRDSDGTEELMRDLQDASGVIDWDKLTTMFPDNDVNPPLPKPTQRPLLSSRNEES